MFDDDPSIDTVAKRVQTLWNKVDQMVDRRLATLAGEVEDNGAAIDDLHARVDELETRMETLAGLGEGEASTPETRCRDLRTLLYNAAEAKADRGKPGTIQWTYDRVQEQLESNGHGTVHPHQAYRAMDDAAKADGYATVEDDDGQQVVRASFDAITANGGVIENNNAEGVTGAGPDLDSTEVTAGD